MGSIAFRAFGGFSGFMAGWLYWASNLPYLPSLLYFGAANALFVGGDSFQEAVSLAFVGGVVPPASRTNWSSPRHEPEHALPHHR